MDYSYEFTDLAIKDISDTLNYISNNLSNSKAASDLLNTIEKTVDNICMFPFSYPNCKYYFIKDESIRHAIINNYVMVFKIFESKIVVLRFKYSKQNRLL